MTKHIFTVIQTLFGLLFIASGLLKLFPIEPVELHMYSFGITSWEATTYFTRLLIGFELAIGILAITQVYRKHVIIIALVTVFLFSLQLLYSTYASPEDNCFCFGSALPMTPSQSLGKNLFIFIAGIFLLRSKNTFHLPQTVFITILSSIIAVATPFIVDTPDPWLKDSKEQFATTEFPAEKLANIENAPEIKGKQILCFFSLSCKYCQMSAQKLTSIEKQLDTALPIHYFLIGDETHLDFFWEKSESKQYRYTFLPPSAFFGIAGKSVPAIFLVDNGMVTEKIGYRKMTDKRIKKFMEQ